MAVGEEGRQNVLQRDDGVRGKPKRAEDPVMPNAMTTARATTTAR